MKYINRLQEENAELRNKLVEVNKSLTDFLVFLSADKFKGVESDGSRKDWIATTDVKLRLQEIRANTLNVG